MADGSVIFNTRLDNKNLEKDLQALKKKIEKAEESIAKTENKKLPLVKQMEALNKELDEANKKLQVHKQRLSQAQDYTSFNRRGTDAYKKGSAMARDAAAGIEEEEAKIANIKKQWEKVNKQVKTYDAEINAANRSLDRNKEKARELTKKLTGSGAAMNKAFLKAKDTTDKFGKRLSTLAGRLLVFSLIANALRSIKNYTEKLLKTNDQYREQMAQLKAALMTAFQPLYEFILPGIIQSMKLLTTLALDLAKAFSKLFGKTVKQSAQTAENLNNIADEAKEAQKSMAGFDEITVVGSGSDTTGSDLEIKPDFSWMSETSDRMSGILSLALSIGAAILAWKITGTFTKALTGSAASFSTLAGAALTAAGVVEYVVNWLDAFENGVSWENLTGMVLSLAAAVGGLALLAGSLGAGIALIVGGAALVAVALKEWIETGEMTNEMLAALEIGILAIGAGFALIVGWPALIVAAIAAIVVAIVAKWDEIKAWFNTKIKPVFTKEYWEEKLSGMKEGFEKVIGKIKAFFTKEYWENIFSNVKEAVKTRFKDAINTMITLANKLIQGLNDKLSFSWKPLSIGGLKIFDGGSIQLVNIPEIPMLAKGAVIPPNAPFMAMLGDQRHGTNIEAPLATIQEAVALVMDDMIQSNMAGHEATVSVLKDILEAVLGIHIGDDVIGQAVERYSSDMAIIRGR